MGIPEYWIVGFRALGAQRFIGSPKQPALSVYRLVEGEYQSNRSVVPTESPLWPFPNGIYPQKPSSKRGCQRLHNTKHDLILATPLSQIDLILFYNWGVLPIGDWCRGLV